MRKVILDRETLSKLRDLQDDLELCDESGCTLGYFSPVTDRSLYDGVDSPISDEELDRRSKQGGGRTLREIFNDLEKLP